MHTVWEQIGRRYRQASKLGRDKGFNAVVDLMRKGIVQRLAPPSIELPVLREDVILADLSRQHARVIPQLNADEDIRINWITTLPSPNSGGHTTMFRMIRYLEKNGYSSRVYFYNVDGADHAYYESIVRKNYGFHGFVGSVHDGMVDAHAVVASAWATAYPAFNSPCAGKRFYFVQDFEPYFHPVGASSLLAENTYRMGFHGITAGKWLATKLRHDFCMEADSFDFGVDTDTYSRNTGSQRNGLVFYARPDTARRGFEIGLMAMEIFARRNPEIDLHLYGEKAPSVPFRCINHGRVSPEQLNRIYNRCFAGLSLSLTNISLVPHEMLAAGCIPVVNDAAHNRVVLDNPFVQYAPAYPQALAAALESIVKDPGFEAFSLAASKSVHGLNMERCWRCR